MADAECTPSICRTSLLKPDIISDGLTCLRQEFCQDLACSLPGRLHDSVCDELLLAIGGNQNIENSGCWPIGHTTSQLHYTECTSSTYDGPLCISCCSCAIARLCLRPHTGLRVQSTHIASFHAGTRLAHVLCKPQVAGELTRVAGYQQRLPLPGCALFTCHAETGPSIFPTTAQHVRWQPAAPKKPPRQPSHRQYSLEGSKRIYPRTVISVASQHVRVLLQKRCWHGCGCWTLRVESYFAIYLSRRMRSPAIR